VQREQKNIETLKPTNAGKLPTSNIAGRGDISGTRSQRNTKDSVNKWISLNDGLLFDQTSFEML